MDGSVRAVSTMRRPDGHISPDSKQREVENKKTASAAGLVQNPELSVSFHMHHSVRVTKVCLLNKETKQLS